ncbi:MAG: Lipopolysaccharide export system permease protein [Verrucomicrobiaceae bacterium]|nr:Lipopolysaccharide export system permease protein [Verrucomicrobiaceae bacterium]
MDKRRILASLDRSMTSPAEAPSIVSRLRSAVVTVVLAVIGGLIAQKMGFDLATSAVLVVLALTGVLLIRYVVRSLRIFDRYIWGQVWSGMFTGVMVLSGVMVLGNVYKKMDQLLGDTKLPVWFVLKFMGLVIPYSLVFTIPWAFLTSILLVYGRMSADNEMVSIRMTGQPMWRICAPVFAMAVLLCGVCFYVNVDLAPSSKNQMKRLFYDVATDNPITLFQEGRVLDKMPGFRIYTGKQKKGTNELENLQLIQLDGNTEKQFIRAKTAKLVRTPGKLDFDLELHDATLEQVIVAPEGNVEKVNSAQLGETAITFPLSDLKGKTERINASMKDTSALWAEVKSSVDSVTNEPMNKKQRSVSLTELNKRYSFSLACLTFALVGIPLGITAQRRETTIGFVLSLVTAVVYLVFIFFADGQNDKPSIYPHLLMWLPNLVFLSIGGTLFYRLSKR